jgi:Flp pilus assembly protein TadD
VTLRWDGPIQGDRLVLRIRDEKRIVHRAELKPTVRAYTVPSSALSTGPWYVWSVTAAGEEEDPLSCYAKLRVLTRQERMALEQEERLVAAARASAPDQPAAPMRLALLYERLGMFEQARAACEAAQRLRPEDPAVRAALTRLNDAAPP